METSKEPPAGATTARASVPFKCQLCGRGHSLKFCRRFRGMDVERRLRAVVKYRYCARCLAQSHLTARCPSGKTCNICSKDHHHLLHVHETSRKRSTGAKPKSPAPPRQGLVSRSARETLAPLTTTGQSSLILLPTCKLQLVISQHRSLVRGILNPCTDTSKVLMSALQPSGMLKARVNEQVELILTSVHDAAVRIRFTATVVRTLNQPTPPTEAALSVRQRLANFKLADDDFWRPSAIQLVLGGNVYHQIVLPTLIQQPGLPLAQDSVLGWVISGPCQR